MKNNYQPYEAVRSASWYWGWHTGDSDEFAKRLNQLIFDCSTMSADDAYDKFMTWYKEVNKGTMGMDPIIEEEICEVLEKEYAFSKIAYVDKFGAPISKEQYEEERKALLSRELP